ncbi:DivIVA domain-containing protein [Kribbella sp. CA-294648]|uniref:DivIVA domain-containing protein n=1 Tax=Kribbella sp. CA-294648 TaxID=3239948 RepID=UPI003D94A3B5
MWFFGLIVVLLIGAVAVVASGRWGAMAPAYDDRPDLTVPARQALTAEDLAKARFGVGLRGYRMDEVDTLLERVTREVAERDRRIADLERAVSPIIHGPEGAGFTSRSEYDATDFEDTGYNKPILVGGDFPTPEPTPVAAREQQEPAASPEPPEQAALAQPQAAGSQDALAVAPPDAPPPTEATAQPEAQVGAQPEATATADALPEPNAVTDAEAPAEPADVVQEDEEREPASVLDGPQAPVPLPPLLQELVHTHDANEPEPTPWFEAKPPPPDHTADPAAEGATDADPETDSDEASGEPRGRHSAAPDLGAVQRPN